jgi:hypothetical protein
MALFGKKAELQEVTFELTILEADETNPALTLQGRAIPERLYSQLFAEWFDHPDRRDPNATAVKGQKVGQDFADHIVMYGKERGVEWVRMTGLTVGNQARVTPLHVLTEEDQKRFREAGPEGVRLDKQEFIGLCDWCPGTVAGALVVDYDKKMKAFTKEHSVMGEAARKNSLNGPVAALESAA